MKLYKIDADGYFAGTFELPHWLPGFTPIAPPLMPPGAWAHWNGQEWDPTDRQPAGHDALTAVPAA